MIISTISQFPLFLSQPYEPRAETTLGLTERVNCELQTTGGGRTVQGTLGAKLVCCWSMEFLSNESETYPGHISLIYRLTA